MVIYLFEANTASHLHACMVDLTVRLMLWWTLRRNGTCVGKEAPNDITPKKTARSASRPSIQSLTRVLGERCCRRQPGFLRFINSSVPLMLREMVWLPYLGVVSAYVCRGSIARSGSRFKRDGNRNGTGLDFSKCYRTGQDGISC